MRIGQDLCIALVLAVVGAGFGKPAPPRTEPEGLEAVEQAMAESGFSPDEMQTVRSLIARAQERERAGDEDGAATAMARASAILRIG